MFRDQIKHDTSLFTYYANAIKKKHQKYYQKVAVFEQLSKLCDDGDNQSHD